MQSLYCSKKAPIIINDLVNALTTMIPIIIETGVKLLVALIKDLPEYNYNEF